MSQFNLENLTTFSSDSDSILSKRKVELTPEETMDVDAEEGEHKEPTADKKATSVPIDYNLYKKFWSLQDYFRKPTQCYEKVPWKTFTNYSNEVLNCFESYKLDDLKSKKKKKQVDSSSATASTQ